jgi:O-acetyl-ADP-ribose deacetylase (regulator of RNase III)
MRAIAIAEARDISVVGMPRIGAGLGGLDWADVKRVIEAIGSQTKTVLAVYERPQPSRISR